MSTDGSRVAIFAALSANLGIALSKFVAFAFTGSSAMFAEGVHSTADTGNQVLLLIGARRARRPPSDAHPFGYGQFRYLYGFLVSLIIFLLGGLFALYEGWHKVNHPEPIESPVWAFAVLGVAVVLESLSLRTAAREVGDQRGDESWLGFIRLSAIPELVVVILEDFGALVGLVFALIGVALAVITGNGVWDGVGTLAIGVLLVAIAILLSREMRSLLLGESARPEVLDRIVGALLAEPSVDRVIHMRTMHLGPEELLIAAKVAMPAVLTVRDAAEAVDAAEARVRAAIPLNCLIYLELDVDRTPSL